MRDKIKLLSTGKNAKGKPTGTFKARNKNKKKTTTKIKLKCFDSKAYDAKTGKTGMHVLFEETKI